MFVFLFKYVGMCEHVPLPSLFVAYLTLHWMTRKVH